jgi:hypothetical protein
MDLNPESMQRMANPLLIELKQGGKLPDHRASQQ